MYREKVWLIFTVYGWREVSRETYSEFDGFKRWAYKDEFEEYGIEDVPKRY